MAETQGNQSAALGGKLKNLEIVLANYRKDAVVDLRPFVTDITIYENIFNPTLHGVLSVIDAAGLLSGYGFNIAGEETLRIKYAVADETIPERDLEFFVYKIAPVINGQNLKHKRYVIYFTSREEMENASDCIQKAYSTSNDEIVKDILGSYLRSKKSYEAEPARLGPPVIIPALKPFDAIEWLRGRSISRSKFYSASYLFFETTEKFIFGSVEWLIEKGREKIKSKPQTYTYHLSQSDLQRMSEDGGDDQDPRNYNRFEFKSLFDFVQAHRIDTIEKMKMGVWSSNIQIFDPVNLTIAEKRFAFDPIKSTTLGKMSEHTNDFDTDMALNRKGKMRRFWIAQDSTLQPNFLDEIKPASASYMTRLAQNMFQAKCIGDPSIVAGDVITVPKMPAFRTPDGKGNDDKLLSGEFLIVGITHKIGQEAYACDLELYRNGFNADMEKPVSLAEA